MANELLQVRGLGKTYRGGPSEVEVLRDLDFVVQAKEAVAIVGASGVGKSTLLHLLGTLDRPTSGEVLFQGMNIFARNDDQLALFRNQSVGFIFQFHYLLPEFTAEENVTLPLQIRGVSLVQARSEAKQLLKSVGLESRAHHKPMELSGGEQQRVAIARALIAKPSLILADEPTGNLDVETARTVTEILLRVVKDQEKSLVVATHNIELAKSADRILRLKDKRLFEEKL